MKKNHTKWYALAALAFAAITFSSWKNGGSALPVKPFSINYQDDTTIRHKKEHKEYRVGDLDQALKDLDKATIDIDKNMKLDFGKMEKEIKTAMDEVKKIDFDKIGNEVALELKKMDWSKTRAEIDKAMREVEIRMKEVDKQKIQAEIQKAKASINAEKLREPIDVDKIKKHVEEGLAQAKKGIEKAKKEIAQLKEFTEGLESDGLINRKKGYKIEIRDGEMYINGTKQSKEVNDKYRKYFKDEKNYTIRSDGDEVSHI